jgi:hypothetical protein
MLPIFCLPETAILRYGELIGEALGARSPKRGVPLDFRIRNFSGMVSEYKPLQLFHHVASSITSHSGGRA